MIYEKVYFLFWQYLKSRDVMVGMYESEVL